jgi:hypothetical protein
MSQITITSSNFNGYTGDITFYPFSGGSISYGSQTIPYTIETENFNGEYTIDLTYEGVPVSCGLQVGSSPCVYITADGESISYSGLYEYVGQGYLQYSSKVPDEYDIICSDTDPKSKALYILKTSNGIQTTTHFMGNVYESFLRTEQVSIVKFINYNVAGNPCGQSISWPATYVAYPTYSSQGFPKEGNYSSGISGQGTYLLENNPSCQLVPDVDANAYLEDVIAAGGTTNPTINNAVNTLFEELKTAGLYSKMIAMYPFVGSTASSHSINATLNKTFDITWFGGMTHGISGSTSDGINGYGNPVISGNDYLNVEQSAFGIYVVSPDTDAAGVHGGYFGAGKTRFQLGTNYSNTWGWAHGAGSFQQTANGGLNDGSFMMVRTGITESQLYRNTTNIDTYTSGVGISSELPILLFTMTSGTSPGAFYTNDTLGFAFFADNLLYSEVSTLDGIINTFQTSLGRNTY